MLAAQALERATGTPPALVRSGGSIPVVAEFAARGIPTIVSGFTLPDDAFHAPDESFLVANLELGERAGRELLHAARGALTHRNFGTTPLTCTRLGSGRGPSGRSV